MPTRSSLEALFGPRARIRDIDPVTSGSPGRFSLRPEPGFFRTVDVAVALARRGVRMSIAKQAVERLMVGKATAIDAPCVEDHASFADELASLAVKTEAIRTPTSADVAADA